MKIYSYILALCIFFAYNVTFSHEVDVHRRITEHAAASAVVSSSFKGFTEVISSDCPYEKVVISLVDGSEREDDIDKDEGGKRSFGHFYDPLAGIGLENIPPDDRLKLGVDSFTWASKRNSPAYDFGGFFGIVQIAGNIGKYNKWSWQNARDHQWQGLTAPNISDRFTALTNMFRSVGQVVHLLEDTSQPQHVRNEQHLDKFGENGPDTPWRSPIEDYGKKYLASLNYQHSMLDWKAAGFTKLEDFWNRHLYNGNASALSGGAKLGLAEFSNGNFVGDRHLYPEYFTPGKVAYYPFPSRDKSTNYRQVKANPNSGVDTFTLPNGHQGKGIYIKKNADGIIVNHHTRMNYLGAKTISGLAGTPFCTIRDDKVLADYHAALIPKAVEYSAGLLDYYFRGRLDVCLGLGPTAGTYSLNIINRSGQKFQGGEFRLFWDDASGWRTEIAAPSFTTTYATSLEDNGTITAQFTIPAGTVSAYILVYNGTIGVNGSTALDPVDATIAVAAKRFSPTCLPSVGTPTPASLAYSDTANLATIALDRYSQKVAFGSYPLAIYKIMYVGGTYRSHVRPDYPFGPPLQPNQPVWGTAWGGGPPYLAGTKAYYFGSGGEDETGYLPGTYDCASESAVVNATLLGNATIEPFIHVDGAISLKPVINAWICTNWEVDDSGGPTYRLERAKSFFPQPERVRIKEFSTVEKPSMPPCQECLAAPQTPEWDGGLPDKSPIGETSLSWESAAVPLSISGLQLDHARLRFSAVGGPGSGGWELLIFCKQSGGGSSLLWRGLKTTGTDPIGGYQNSNPCPGQPCCFTVESY